MVKTILVLALGIAIGHYGPVGFAKLTMHATTTVLQASGNVVAGANNLIPSK
jgi:hypothetical protein